MFGFNRSAMEYALMGLALFFLVTTGAMWIGKSMKAKALEEERAAHSVTQRKLSICESQLIGAHQAIDAQNAKVEEWVARADEYAQAAEKAQADAKAQARRYESTIAKLRSLPLPTEQCPQTKAYVQRYLQEERTQ